MNKEALLRLADKLDGSGPYESVGPVKPETFNMNGWKCGTAHCACGHAANDMWFNDRGLIIQATTSQYGVHNWTTIMYGDRKAYDAAAAFFDVSGGTAEFLFDPSSYDAEPGVEFDEDDETWEVPSNIVSDRIRRFVANGQE